MSKMSDRKIFVLNFDFILGEHKLIGCRSRNLSKNFSNSWKWCQIFGISKILGKNFSQFFVFVLGEDKLIGGCSRNFSKYFSNS